ncbi:MAG: hypothetical protein O3A82_06015 [Verrucomicrobia bacterium]|nr:hypothetical protein [Verrucomicrobiota bacterium]
MAIQSEALWGVPADTVGCPSVHWIAASPHSGLLAMTMQKLVDFPIVPLDCIVGTG